MASLLSGGASIDFEAMSLLSHVTDEVSPQSEASPDRRAGSAHRNPQTQP